jgi:hypothetical protein
VRAQKRGNGRQVGLGSSAKEVYVNVFCVGVISKATPDAFRRGLRMAIQPISIVLFHVRVDQGLKDPRMRVFRVVVFETVHDGK